MKIQSLLKKYENQIKEEVNVKELHLLDKNINIKKIFKPIWSKIAPKYWKEVGGIIKNAKKGNIKQLEDWKIIVFDWQREWVLEKEDYEIAYEWIDNTNMIADNNIIVKLDLEIDEQLKEEWIIRELSRSLNQLRKDADYPLEARVKLYIVKADGYLKKLIEKYDQFLKNEVLLSDIIFQEIDNVDIKKKISIENYFVVCWLKK